MWRRGANLEGDTANFIETEQLLETEEFKFSFLQVLLYIIYYQLPEIPFYRFSAELAMFSTSILSVSEMRIGSVVKHAEGL